MAIDRSGPPPAGPAPALRLPDFERHTLSNGLRVWIAPRHALPEVSIRLIVEAGAALDPPSRCGAAELTGRLLSEGAGPRSAPRMAEWLDRLGASFTVSASYDVTVVSMHLLNDVLEGALDYLVTAVREPTFAEAETDRVRQERLDEIERDGDEPAIVAKRQLIAAIYGPHPYGRPSAGLYESVMSLTAADVRDFHAGCYRSRDAALIVGGDVDPPKLLAGLDARFGDWQPGAAAVELPSVPDSPVRPGRPLVVDRPGSPQAEIRLGSIGAPFRTDDLYAIMVANSVLGGLFNSRINMNLREDKGWTYGARSSFEFRRQAGPFIIRTAVETGVTADAIGELLGEVERLRTEPPTEEEMRLAKNALVLSLPRQFETVHQVTAKQARLVTFGVPLDFWTRYASRVEAVSRDEVTEVIDRYLTTDSLVILVVGDGEQVSGPLERFGRVEVTTAAPARA